MARTILRNGYVVAALLIAHLPAPLVGAAAAADAPVYKDAERAAPFGYPSRQAPEVLIEVGKVCCGGGQGHRRPVNGGPGYVGSVRGLGRPSYDGLSPPPGYGSYREHPFD